MGLGLGELVVQSHLGKPLRASIAVMDTPADIQTECFSLHHGGEASLPGVHDARIRLETRKGRATLFITTTRSVNEPAFQITVRATCADRLERQYVVLLDPPAVSEPEIATAEALPPTDIPAERPAVKPAPRSRGVTNRARAKAVKRVVDAKPVATDTAPAPAKREKPKSETAKLVLSGGNYIRDKGVDTAIAKDDRDPNADGSARMSPTELSDEHTALKHRLAYLQTQLLALQQRNNELEAARRIQIQPAQMPPARPEGDAPAISRWTQFLSILGILTLGAALYFGLRAYPRRGARADASAPLPSMLTDVPHPFSGEPAVVADIPPARPVAQTAADEAEPLVDAPALMSDGAEVNEDILDQAEVFVAHGHASLAIHMLQEYVRNAPAESPVPWLLLLDLLSREGADADYRATCVECKKHYNINLSLPAQSAHADGTSLEAYPHVIAHLQHVWGYREALPFLADLVYDRRNGTRQGFEPGAYREIVLLHSLAEKLEFTASVPTLYQAAERETDQVRRELEWVTPQPQSLDPEPLPLLDFPEDSEWPFAQQPVSTFDEIQQRVMKAPTASPIPWLQLLNWLARDKRHQEFYAARSECQILFNVNLTDPVATPLLPDQADLEGYPHIVEQLQAVWHTPDAEYFLSDLIYDQRGGSRQGFDLGAYLEILLLHAMVEQEVTV